MRTRRRKKTSNLEAADLPTASHTEVESNSNAACRQFDAGQADDRDAIEEGMKAVECSSLIEERSISASNNSEGRRKKRKQKKKQDVVRFEPDVISLEGNVVDEKMAKECGGKKPRRGKKKRTGVEITAPVEELEHPKEANGNLQWRPAKGPAGSATLYVEGLSGSVTEATLYHEFDKIGNISSIKIKRNRDTRRSLGIAYVTFTDSRHADEAVQKMQHHRFFGRACHVEWFQPDPSLRLRGKSSVYVCKLVPEIDNKMLFDTFSEAGQVSYCKVVYLGDVHQKHGFVYFEEEEAALNATEMFNGCHFSQGHWLEVGPLDLFYLTDEAALPQTIEEKYQRDQIAYGRKKHQNLLATIATSCLVDAMPASKDCLAGSGVVPSQPAHCSAACLTSVQKLGHSSSALSGYIPSGKPHLDLDHGSRIDFVKDRAPKACEFEAGERKRMKRAKQKTEKAKAAKAAEQSAWMQNTSEELKNIPDGEIDPYADKWDCCDSDKFSDYCGGDGGEEDDILVSFIDNDILVWSFAYIREIAKPRIWKLLRNIEDGPILDSLADPVDRVMEELDWLFDLNRFAEVAPIPGAFLHGSKKAQTRVIQLLGDVCEKAITCLMDDAIPGSLAHVKLIRSCIKECLKSLPLNEKLADVLNGFVCSTLSELDDAHRKQLKF
jgi:RNA recognition motif-containing protein